MSSSAAIGKKPMIARRFDISAQVLKSSCGICGDSLLPYYNLNGEICNEWRDLTVVISSRPPAYVVHSNCFEAALRRAKKIEEGRVWLFDAPFVREGMKTAKRARELDLADMLPQHVSVISTLCRRLAENFPDIRNAQFYVANGCTHGIYATPCVWAFNNATFPQDFRSLVGSRRVVAPSSDVVIGDVDTGGAADGRLDAKGDPIIQTRRAVRSCRFLAIVDAAVVGNDGGDAAFCTRVSAQFGQLCETADDTKGTEDETAERQQKEEDALVLMREVTSAGESAVSRYAIYAPSLRIPLRRDGVSSSSSAAAATTAYGPTRLDDLGRLLYAAIDPKTPPRPLLSTATALGYSVQPRVALLRALEPNQQFVAVDMLEIPEPKSHNMLVPVALVPENGSMLPRPSCELQGVPTTVILADCTEMPRNSLVPLQVPIQAGAAPYAQAAAAGRFLGCNIAQTWTAVFIFSSRRARPSG